jgi:hypothetical protein
MQSSRCVPSSVIQPVSYLLILLLLAAWYVPVTSSSRPVRPRMDSLFISAHGLTHWMTVFSVLAVSQSMYMHSLTSTDAGRRWCTTIHKHFSFCFHISSVTWRPAALQTAWLNFPLYCHLLLIVVRTGYRWPSAAYGWMHGLTDDTTQHAIVACPYRNSK